MYDQQLILTEMQYPLKLPYNLNDPAIVQRVCKAKVRGNDGDNYAAMKLVSWGQWVGIHVKRLNA
jgi:hypothetical protein